MCMYRQDWLRVMSQAEAGRRQEEQRMLGIYIVELQTTWVQEVGKPLPDKAQPSSFVNR